LEFECGPRLTGARFVGADSAGAKTVFGERLALREVVAGVRENEGGIELAFVGGFEERVDIEER
jgi:hypothetical protein